MQSRPNSVRADETRPRRAAPYAAPEGIERLWRVLVSRRTIGALLVAAGVLCIVAPLGSIPSPLFRDWWTTAAHFPDIARAVAALWLCGALWVRRDRWKFGAGWPGADLVVEGETAAEREALDEYGQQLGRARQLRAWVGSVLMGAGLVIVVFVWLAHHQNLPASQLVLRLNEPVEHYEVDHGHRRLRVMLPLRATLRGMTFGQTPGAQVRFARPGEDPRQGSARTLRPGDSLDIENVRVSFIGFSKNAESLRAVIAGTGPDTIEASGFVGDTVRVSLEGPEYEILDIAPNYLDAMGPAVRVASEERGEFWVFARARGLEVGRERPDFGHDLELVEVQRVPAAIFSVVRIGPLWPLGLGSGLFVVGWLLLLLFPERLTRRLELEGPGGAVRPVWAFASLNEAGALADELRETFEHADTATDNGTSDTDSDAITGASASKERPDASTPTKEGT